MDTTGPDRREQALAVVLAAGGSTRMGRCKALLDWHGEPLIRRHIQVFESITSQVRVVTGAHTEAIAECVGWHRVVENPRWKQTEMIDSLRIAVADWTGPLLVTPVDTPPASVPWLKILCAGPTAVPVTADGRRGHPVWLAPQQVRELASAASLREVLRTALEVDGPPECALDFDDPRTLRRVRDGG